jgi:hypothetical protein
MNTRTHTRTHTHTVVRHLGRKSVNMEAVERCVRVLRLSLIDPDVPSMNEWMHKGWALVPRPSMIYCASSFLVNTLLILHFEWNIGLCLWGRHNSHVVPKKTGPVDEILNTLWPHNHIGCVWLIHLFPGTVHKLDYLSVPAWKVVLSGDSVL